MIANAKFFDNMKDLEVITGKTEDELWNAGFNLDDMDWGFVADERWEEDRWWTDENSNAYFMYHILGWMDSYCVGYTEVEYEGKWYYTLHHS